MSLYLNEEVKLKTTENAWKPSRLEDSGGKYASEKEIQELLKNVRGILNKLTPQNFDKLLSKFKELPINSETKLQEVINLIFEKATATDQPSFAKVYAQMCYECQQLDVKNMVNNKEVNFRKLIITKCQLEFETNKEAELDAEKWHESINSSTDPEKRKEMQLAYKEKERAIRMKSVGNIRFIGELFKLGMLSQGIICRCIEQLLSNCAEESLERLCILFTTVGRELEFRKFIPGPPGQPPIPVVPYTFLINQFFAKMAELAWKKENSKVSSRVRFMLQDVIDLRRNKWVLRREDNNPKMIEQINKEVERESQLSQERALAFHQQPLRMNRQHERQDNRKRNQSDPKGWSLVGPQRNNINSAFDASKMHNLQKQDYGKLQFSGSLNYCFLNKDTMVQEKPTNTSPFMSSNAYALLHSGEEERKPPQSKMNNKRMTPTPSIEKELERQRMLHQAKESDEHNSQENSIQRENQNSAFHQPPVIIPTHPKKDNDKAPQQSEEPELKVKLENKTETLLEEYLADYSSVEDVKTEVDAVFDRHTRGGFVRKVLEIVLEKKAPAHINVGLLLAGLLDAGILSTQIISQQFDVIYEMAEEIAIDIPKIWEHQAQMIAPMLATQKMNFGHFRDACRSVLKTETAANLLHPVLSLLASDKGEPFVRNLWDSSNVTLKDFLPEEVDVNAFIKEKSLKYLIEEAPKYEVRSMDNRTRRSLTS